MSLANLERIGQLEAVHAQSADIARLVDAADRALADAKVPAVSAEGRFDSAYRAIMQTANAALQASGYRTLTSKPGHHRIMIQSLPHTPGIAPALMVQLDALRKQRNGIDYTGDIVGESMAAEAVAQAEALLALLRDWLAKHPLPGA